MKRTQIILDKRKINRTKLQEKGILKTWKRQAVRRSYWRLNHPTTKSIPERNTPQEVRHWQRESPRKGKSKQSCTLQGQLTKTYNYSSRKSSQQEAESLVWIMVFGLLNQDNYFNHDSEWRDAAVHVAIAEDAVKQRKASLFTVLSQMTRWQGEETLTVECNLFTTNEDHVMP